MNRAFKVLAVALAAASMTGCAAMQEKKRLKLMATDNVQLADSEVSAARASGAPRYMQSGKTFRLAETSLSAAKRSLDRKDYQEADRLARAASQMARKAVMEAEQAEAARKKGLDTKKAPAKPGAKRK